MKYILSLVLFVVPAISAEIFNPSLSKIEGCVIGAAVGDALGRITEFQYDTAEQVEYMEHLSRNVPDVTEALITYKGSRIMPYTDDTVIARIIFEESLINRKAQESDELLMKSLAYRFIELFGPEYKIVDPLYALRAHGATCKRGAERLQKVRHTKVGWWDIVAKNHDEIKSEGGCGSVMRVWPLGIVYGADSNKVKLYADAQSRLTHRSPMARAACAACALGVTYALQDKPMNFIIEAMISVASEYDQEEMIYKKGAQQLGAAYDFVGNQDTVRGLLKADKLLTSDMLRYACAMAQAGVSPDKVLGMHEPHAGVKRTESLRGWSADEALAAALYIFVRHPNNLKDAILEGVNTPGDSDSIASLAGALVGAYSGIGTLPKELYAHLEKRNELKELVAYSYALNSMAAKHES